MIPDGEQMSLSADAADPAQGTEAASVPSTRSDDDNDRRAAPGGVTHAEGSIVQQGAFLTNATVYGHVFGTVADSQIIFQDVEQAYDVRGLPNPYLGLSSFSYTDRERYAGREQAIAAAIQTLTAPGDAQVLLFVTGASGSGKSSFAQAGLVPALEAHYRERSIHVRHAVFRPSRNPLAGLADALLQLGLPHDSESTISAESVYRFVQGNTTNQQINVLVIDQFEELFSQSESAQRDTLFDLLSDLPAFPALRTHIILTMRSDYLPDLFARAALYDAAKRGIDLRAMSEPELRVAIQRPLQQLRSGGDKRFEDALLQHLAHDAAGDAAFLPLLQVTLEDLWSRGSLRFSAYGTLTDAIQQRAEDVYDYADYAGAHQIRRSMEEQSALMRIFLDLVAVSLDDDARRDVRRRRPAAELEQRRPDSVGLIEDLCAARLLSKDLETRADGVVEVVDIIHESLIGNWDRLWRLIADQRQVLRQRGRFEQLVREWLARNRDDAYLLEGVRLAEAQELDRRDDIALHSPDARELLRRSLARRDAEQRREVALERRARRALSVLVCLLGALVLAGGGILGRQELLRQRVKDAGDPLAIAGLGIAFERDEVTNRRYQDCVDAGRCATPPPDLSTYYQSDTSTLPVTGIDGLQASTFCLWIDRRLPSDDEWRFAATRGHRSPWPWGAVEPRPVYANLLVNGAGLPADRPEPVGSHPRGNSPDGLRDLIGNVRELLATTDEGKPWDGPTDLTVVQMMIDGGSFGTTRSELDFAKRAPKADMSYRSNDLGFRCVQGMS